MAASDGGLRRPGTARRASLYRAGQSILQPCRFYHNLDHLKHVLEVIDSLKATATDLPAVKLAAWFHDAVYDSRAKDNEERSARWAQEWLNRFGLTFERIERIAAMIRATQTHENAAEDSDTQILLDADLAILGESAEVYDAYASAIRQEYAWAPEEAYRAGRANVIRRFLRRPRIYGLELMRQLREARSRENLQRELRRLS